jgi:anti-anti-sigma factor
MGSAAGLFEMRQDYDVDGAVRLSLIGELDLTATDPLKLRLRSLREDGASVRLDLSRLEFTDSSGLRALITSAEDAHRAAVEEARLRDGELTVVLAWQFPLIGIPGAFDPEKLEEEAKDILRKEVAAVKPPPDVRLEQFVAQGDSSASLITACERISANLLVLGSRGREGFVGLRLGSTSQECAQHAPCPVVIVKPPTPAVPESEADLRAVVVS